MSANFSINGLGLNASDTAASRLGWQIAQRVQFIVNQLARQKAGEPADEIARELQGRLRRLGVIPNAREINAYATKIAGLKAGGQTP
jgi:hypothetical protein